MPRRADLSRPINTKPSALQRFGQNISANEIQILTGWSRATLYRRMRTNDFPPPVGYRARRLVWNVLAVLEWVSQFNLQTLMPMQEYVQYERALREREFADPTLRTVRGRLIERENVRRKLAGDGPYAEMAIIP